MESDCSVCDRTFASAKEISSRMVPVFDSSKPTVGMGEARVYMCPKCKRNLGKAIKVLYRPNRTSLGVFDKASGQVELKGS